ncbi:MAG: hypothetical protein NTW28_09465, partial [Candidatus Solibacter sp.]|nr:hypothetical protein [Candidatus Solibacter sp.]
DVARLERVNADHRCDDAHKLANSLLFELYTSVQKLPGSTPVQAEMAGRTLQYYDRLSAAKSADRTLQAELAEGYLRLGDVLGNPFEKNLGDTPKAQESYRKALAIAEPLAKTETADVRARLALAKIHQQLGGGLVFAGKADEGLALVQKAADEFERVVAVKPGDPQIRISAAQAYQFLGRNLSQRGGWVSTQDGDRAMASVRKGMEHIETALRAEPRNVRALRIQAAACQVIGNMLSTTDPTRSLEMYSRSLGILGSIPEPDRNGMDVRRLRASLLLNIGWDLGQKQKYRESIATLHEARDILDGIARDDPRDMAASYHRTAAYRNLGIVHGYAKEDAASLENYGKSVEILTSLSERDPANANYPLYRAEQQARMGNLLARAGRMEEAERVARAGIGYLTALAARPAAPSSQLQDAARHLMETEVKPLRNYPLALVYAKRANELTKGLDAGTLEYLAEAYWVNGDARGAADTIRQALALLPPPAAGEKPSRPRKMFQEQLERYQKAAGASAQSRK